MVTAVGPDSRVSESKLRKVLHFEKALLDFGDGGGRGGGSDPVI